MLASYKGHRCIMSEREVEILYSNGLHFQLTYTCRHGEMRQDVDPAVRLLCFLHLPVNSVLVHQVDCDRYHLAADFGDETSGLPHLFLNKIDAYNPGTLGREAE